MTSLSFSRFLTFEMRRGNQITLMIRTPLKLISLILMSGLFSFAFSRRKKSSLPVIPVCRLIVYLLMCVTSVCVCVFRDDDDCVDGVKHEEVSTKELSLCVSTFCSPHNEFLHLFFLSNNSHNKQRWTNRFELKKQIKKYSCSSVSECEDPVSDFFFHQLQLSSSFLILSNSMNPTER